MTAQVLEKDDLAKSIGSVWSERYQREGRIWGDDPSISGKIFAKGMETDSRGIEIGFGYGRDMLHAVHLGHRMYGIELAGAGHAEAGKLMEQHIISGQVQLLRGDFAKAVLPGAAFDGLLSHRVIHLLGKNGLVDAFAHHAARVLKPGGLIVVSARNPKDFNPDQMKMREDGLAESTIPGRSNHLIRFWDEALFRKTFTEDFENFEFIEGSEIESIRNPVPSHFTIMIARKKLHP